MNHISNALQILHDVGWVKSAYGPNEERCIITAHQESRNNHRDTSDVRRERDVIWSVIKEQYPDRVEADYCDIMDFNDHADTTFDDIERVLEKAALKWEEQS